MINNCMWLLAAATVFASWDVASAKKPACNMTGVECGTYNRSEIVPVRCADQNDTSAMCALGGYCFNLGDFLLTEECKKGCRCEPHKKEGKPPRWNCGGLAKGSDSSENSSGDDEDEAAADDTGEEGSDSSSGDRVYRCECDKCRDACEPDNCATSFFAEDLSCLNSGASGSGDSDEKNMKKLLKPKKLNKAWEDVCLPN